MKSVRCWWAMLLVGCAPAPSRSLPAPVEVEPTPEPASTVVAEVETPASPKEPKKKPFVFPRCETDALACDLTCYDDFFFRHKYWSCQASLVPSHRKERLRSFSMKLQNPTSFSNRAVVAGERIKEQFRKPLETCWQQVAVDGVPPIVELKLMLAPSGEAAHFDVIGPEGPFRACVKKEMRAPRGVPVAKQTAFAIRAVAVIHTDPPQRAK